MSGTARAKRMRLSAQPRRTKLLFGTVVCNLVLGLTSAIALPRLTEYVVDAKLDAVIVELAAAPVPALRSTEGEARGISTGLLPVDQGTVPAQAAAPAVPSVPAAAATTTTLVPADSLLTRATVDARPSSPGAAEPTSVAEAVDAAFAGRGIARASDEQQLSLAKAACSAFDQGHSWEEVVERALQEDGTTRSGVERFLEVATATVCPEHRRS